MKSVELTMHANVRCYKDLHACCLLVQHATINLKPQTTHLWKQVACLQLPNVLIPLHCCCHCCQSTHELSHTRK